MFLRPAVITLSLFVFGISCTAQMPNLGGSPANFPRPGLPSARDMFNSVTGRVVTADNKPLKDVRVELRNGMGSSVASAYTNSSGTFEFPQIQAGSYEVIAVSGVSQTQERIEVGQTLPNLVLRLPVSSQANDGNGSSSVSVAQLKIPSKAREAFNKARDNSEKGKNAEAEKQLAKALEAYPKYADALTLRGILKMDAGNIAGAIEDLQQAIADDSNCAMAYLVMGSVFNSQAKFDDAIRVLERGEALSPASWQAYFEMGKALAGKGQYEPALRQLDRAQTLVPKDYPAIHMLKAHVFFGLNNYSEALTELQAYLAKEPQGPHTAEAEKMMSQAKAFAARSAK